MRSRSGPPSGPARQRVRQPGRHSGHGTHGEFTQPTVPLRQQPSGAAPSGAGSPQRKKGSAAWWVLGLTVAAILVAAVLVLGFVRPGWFVRTVFDAGGVQLGVQQVLQGPYHLDAVQSVICPPGEPVRPAQTFDCQVHLGAVRQHVTITVLDAAGDYEVSLPK
jgi:hypothetical protein